MISEVEVYTLVLDLDETLIHYECDDRDGDYYLIRPGALKFLKELALYYEIVIFTAAMPEVSILSAIVNSRLFMCSMPIKFSTTLMRTVSWSSIGFTDNIRHQQKIMLCKFNKSSQ